MIRHAFTMRLKPDALIEYKHHHDHLWPELAAEIELSGIGSITTFQRGLDLFLVSEVSDDEAWDRLWSSPVHKRWAEVMEPLMNLAEDGTVEADLLSEVFHFAANGHVQAPTAHGAETSADAATSDAMAGNAQSIDPLAELLAERAEDHSPAPSTDETPGRQATAAPPAKRPQARKTSTAGKRTVKKTAKKTVKKKSSTKKSRSPAARQPATAAKRTKKKASRKKSLPKKAKTKKASSKKSVSKPAAKKGRPAKKLAKHRGKK